MIYAECNSDLLLSNIDLLLSNIDLMQWQINLLNAIQNIYTTMSTRLNDVMEVHTIEHDYSKK